MKGLKGDTGAAGPTGDLEIYCALAQAKPFVYSNVPCRAQSYTVDTGGANDVGSMPSVEIGTDGSPVISYYDSTTANLEVARCNDPLCASGDETLSTVDITNDVGSYSSLAIGADGNPVISYVDATAHQLKLVHCNDPACAGDDETANAVAGFVSSSETSLAIDADGNPLISYRTYFLDSGDLRLAHCNDPACAGGDDPSQTIDAGAAVVGSHTSLALGLDGNPVISYYDATNGDLKVAHCNDLACAPGGDTVTAVDSAGSVGAFTSLAIGADGNPVISYADVGNTNLKVARCNDPACVGGNETLSTVDDTGNVGSDTSIVIGHDGNPIVSYLDNGGGHLKVARCNDPACAGHNEALGVVDPAPNVGHDTSIALGLEGIAVVAHRDATNGDLKVGHPPVTGS